MLHCENKDCTYWGAEKTLVIPAGPEDARVVVIGEAPGKIENDLGIPFVGASGKLLRKELTDAGLKTEEILFANVCWCRPPENEKPKELVQRTCLLYYTEQWNKILMPGKLFILVGTTATEAFWEEGKRGKAHRADGSAWISIYHPAYILRTPNEISIFKEDLWLAKQIYDSLDKPAAEITYSVVETSYELEQAVKELCEIDTLSFDLETTGLDPFKPDQKILLTGISTEQKTYIFPNAYAEKRRYTYEDLVDGLKTIFAGGAKKIAQNGKFDILWLKTIGIEVENFYLDTMMAQYVLNSREFESIGLKQLTWMYRPELGGYEEEINAEEMSEMAFDKLAAYCAKDAWLCREIALVQEFLLQEEKLMPVIEKVLREATPAIAEVEFAGFKFDRELTKEKAARMLEQEGLLEKKIRAELPISEKEREKIELTSPKQLGDLLFVKMKLPRVKETKGGAASVDKKVLEELAKQGNAFCAELLEMRKLTKIRSTYLENYLEIAGPGDLVHCNYNLGTRGGRLSSSDPNMQNLPKKEVRDCFISRFENGILVEADFKQIELRVSALYSNDENMIRMINAGTDLHKETMAKVLTLQRGHEVLPEEVTDVERQKGKGVNFGLIYGLGAQGLARNIGVGEEEGEVFHEAFFSLFPGVKIFHKQCEETYRKTGYAYSLLGRRRFLGEYPDHEAIRRAMNFPVQSLASDVCLSTLVRLWKFLKGRSFKSKIVATVHDSIVIDTADFETEEVTTKLLEIVDTINLLGKPMPIKFEVDIALGPRWGSLSVV